MNPEGGFAPLPDLPPGARAKPALGVEPSDAGGQDARWDEKPIGAGWEKPEAISLGALRSVRPEARQGTRRGIARAAVMTAPE